MIEEGKCSKVLFATTNKGKLDEMRRIAALYSVHIVALSDIAAELGTAPPHVEETESSYGGNARLKARAYCDWSGRVSLADDTGLEVDALGGRPGVNTANFAGKNCSMPDNLRLLAGQLRGVEDRRARFVCCLVLQDHASERVTYGELRGTVIDEPRGGGGFGYDGVFVPEGEEETLAQIKERDPHYETHRVRAARSLFAQLQHANPK